MTSPSLSIQIYTCDKETVSQQQSKLKTLLEAENKDSYIIYDETEYPLYACTRMWLQSCGYHISDIKLALYDTMLKNYVVISWGKAFPSKIVDMLIQHKNDGNDVDVSSLSLFRD